MFSQIFDPNAQITVFVGTVHGKAFFVKLNIYLIFLFSEEHNFANPREVRKTALKETKKTKICPHFSIFDQHHKTDSLRIGAL